MHRAGEYRARGGTAGSAIAAAPRNALLAALFVLVLIAIMGANPYSARASTFQQHGALNRDGIGVGIIAHRGVSALAPENTLAAVRFAVERGFDFVEVDLRLTSDGVPVLMHDEKLNRTTTGNGKVSDHTLAEIKELDAGSWFGPQFAGERVPTLIEFLEEIDAKHRRALIELKGVWSDEQVAVTVAVLRERRLVNRVVFESFEPANLTSLARLAPEFARVLLAKRWDREILDQAVLLKASAVAARTEVFASDYELIATARQFGIGTMAYTLNLWPTWEIARHYGIDFIFTDDPVGMYEWRGARTQC